MKKIALDGNWIFYRDHGQGEPVILLHGWTGSSFDWARLLPLLAERRRVIAPDQLGFGRSDKPAAAYRLGLFTDLIAKLMANLDIERCHLVGNSMGGHVAAAFALEHPQRLLSLTLVDAAGVEEGAPPTFKLGRFERTAGLLFRLVSLRAYDLQYRHLGPYHDSRWLTPDDVRGHYRSFGHPPGARAAAACLHHIIADPATQLDRRLRELKLPTLIVWGRQDPLLPLRMSDVFLREIPHAQRVLLDYCGHCPQEERPEQLRQVLERFWTHTA